MSRYLVTRTLPPLTPDQLHAIGKTVVAVCNEMQNITWIHSHLTADGKHSFCEFEAPNADVCREHAARANLPVDDVIPLGIEIGPQLFQPTAAA